MDADMHDPIVPAMTESVLEGVTMTSETEETVLDTGMIGKSLTKRTATPYSASDLEFLADLLDQNIRSGHDIPTCFNGNTLSRLIAQSYRAEALQTLNGILSEKLERRTLDLDAALSPPSTGGESEAVALLAPLVEKLRARLITEGSQSGVTVCLTPEDVAALSILCARGEG